MGHPGMKRTKRLVSADHWFPDWAQYINEYVRSCHNCQLTKQSNKRQLGKLQPIETPESPNTTWAMDTIVIGSEARATSAKYVQIIVDHHSRYAWGRATKTNTAEAAITALKHAIGESGAPQRLIVDNGTNFRSKKFQQFANEHRIKLSFISTYHPQANGLCERTNGTIVQQITFRLLDNPKIRWSSALGPALENYNRLPHSATGHAPALVHFKIGLSDSKKIETIRQEVTERSRSFQQQRKAEHDDKHNASTFEINDNVVIRIPSTHPSFTKFSPR